MTDLERAARCYPLSWSGVSPPSEPQLTDPSLHTWLGQGDKIRCHRCGMEITGFLPLMIAAEKLNQSRGDR